MIHPKTGHESAVLKPWDQRNAWTRPENLIVKVTRGMDCDVNPADATVCERGTKSCWICHEAEKDTWYAEITSPDAKVSWLTHGYSVAEALEMAHDLVRTLYEECKAGQTHCHCHDVTWSNYTWEHEPAKVYLAKKCCICEEEVRVEEFEDA